MQININPIVMFRLCDYTPVIGLITNTTTLLAKGVFSIMDSSQATVIGSFKAHVLEASILRSAAIILINVVGISVAFFIYKKITDKTIKDKLFKDMRISRCDHFHLKR